MDVGSKIIVFVQEIDSRTTLKESQVICFFPVALYLFVYLQSHSIPSYDKDRPGRVAAENTTT